MNNQTSRYKYQENIKHQKSNPKLVFGTWFLVISWFLMFGFWCLPARAIDDPQAELTKVIKAYVVAEKPEWAGLEIKITYKFADKTFESLKAYSADAKLEVVDLFNSVKPAGNVIFPVVITEDENSKRIFVWTKVEVFENVVVANQRIKRGMVLDEKMISLKKRDIAMLPNSFFSDLVELISQEVKTTIPKNSTFFAWMVKRQPLVRRGEQVSVIVRAKNLAVKSTGLALSDGYIGGKIKVKQEKSKKTIEGILVSKDVVEVKLK